MIRFETNTKGFESGMLRMRVAFNNGTKEGMWEAMKRLLDDVLNQPPSCPVDTGYMYDHHEVDVEQKGTQVIGILRVVDTPYAAAVHEGVTSRGPIRKWTRPGSGSHWISSKMLRYGHVYYSKVADKLYATLRRFTR